ncbi:divergent polysaccharide deacetylase family protein [Campylobacter sp. VBCF_06 NA8]|uniref:divergent polysaccharide deacetylase family protein n=1 Tax=Campylobacter sp. VBCF_06 NA8 TaxID=2983822 RepID=UPI0022E9E9B7|nr:divergent polysaccharide deacetylase family protein [Campylobacter sp. VBCF_06 NA8]MDA3046605.1 divergent polysaccharide deacetylase family protein [Campylobacter sp. VBCF_06 NA8]
MAKKRTKGRKNAPLLNFNPNFIKYILIAIFCFTCAALSYAVLNKFFKDEPKIALKLPRDENKSEISKPIIQKDKNLSMAKPAPQISPEIKEQNLTQISKTKDEIIKEELAKIAAQSIGEITPKSQEKTEPKISAPSNKPAKTLPKGSKPKLAIIMDDISTSAQITRIKALPIKVTPSIFPPAKNYKNTPALAKNLQNFAIHLPMEAEVFAHDVKALKVGDSYKEIENFLAQIRADFPHAKFINNHTGSKFTANSASMRNLIKAMQKYDFYFVDSRTSAQTKAPDELKRQNLRYVYRDVFIDNTDEVKAVRQMLQKAVQIAQKRGFAIAIGHPKKSTFTALANSADILNGVEVIYLGEIYEYYK